MTRFLRRHSTALIAIAVYNFVFFFPILFMGRAVSPNDVFFSYSPWSSLKPDLVHPQNLLLNDPMGMYSHVAMARGDWRTFHWDPYVAGGMPGFGTGWGVSTPIVLLPAMLLPLEWFQTAMLFLKLNLAFLFAYLWLREERLGRRGAAIGAIVVAAAGMYSVRWLWTITNATVFYPALLWIVRRTFNGKRTSIALVAAIAFCYAMAGFPAAMAYGAYVVLAYALFLGVRRQRRRSRIRPIAAGALGLVIALLLAAPFLATFIRFLQRTAYLEMREKASLAAIYPPSHWKSFIDADRLGNPAYKNWLGDPALGGLNNYVEATIYLGILALVLALIGLFNRHARSRWFWLVAALLIVACMFGAPGVSDLFARLPGFKYSALARASLLLPLAIGYLAAAGAERLVLWIRRFASLRVVLAGAIAIAVAFDLALVAGRFHPYLQPKDVLIPSTPVIEFLRSERGPFRIAPFFDYFWPNTTELFQLQDIRGHLTSEGSYRQMLQRLDPEAWGSQSTVLQFNSLKYNFNDPLAGMLGIRFYVEHRYIDIIKWTTFGATEPATNNLGPMPLAFGATMQRTIPIDASTWALEVPAAIEEERGRGAGLELSLIRDGALLWSRRFTKGDANVMNKLYVPVRGRARAGDVVTLRVRSIGVRGSMSKGDAAAGESPIYYGRVKTPVIFDRELPDGRLFRNLAELPRFWPVTRLRKLNDEEFVAARDVDYASEAVITDDPIMPPSIGASAARVTLASYAPDEQRVIVESSEPAFVASSEKLTPELAVTIDGRRVRPTEINMLFAGVHVPAGRHEVVFSRRIGRAWWWAVAVGAVAWIAVAAWELTSSLQRRRSDRRTARATAG